MRINIKNLCKQIKKDARFTLYWTFENDTHYICNRHYAVKYKMLPREVLIALFSVFAKIPLEGQTLELNRWGNDTMIREKVVAIEPIFKKCENHKPAKCTHIITQQDSLSYRIIKIGESIVKVNQGYMSMVDLDGEHPICGERYDPISFCENQFIILPARFEDAEEEKTIHELLSAS